MINPKSVGIWVRFVEEVGFEAGVKRKGVFLCKIVI